MATIIGSAVLGILVAVVSLLANLPVVALNAVVIPISTGPAVGFLIWLRKENRSPMIKAQNIITGIWVVSFATGAAHIVGLIPGGTTTAVASTTGIEIILWLGLFHITRKLYREGRARNIAAASGYGADDPEIRSLASNSDLATAILAGMLFTTKFIITMNSGFVPELTPEAIRIMGITLGSSLGLISFNFCPSQTNIRKFISRARGSGA